MKLHDVLRKLYNLHEVSSSDKHYLEKERCYSILAICAEKQFERDGWRGHLNEASRWWRRADRPAEALRRASRSIQSNNREIRTFGFTTGAAAYLDLDELDSAESWAQKAIGQDSTDPHAYSVLGRLQKKRGNLVLAEQFFAKARELEMPVTL